jgi:hypothetical protein
MAQALLRVSEDRGQTASPVVVIETSSVDTRGWKCLDKIKVDFE